MATKLISLNNLTTYTSSLKTYLSTNYLKKETTLSSNNILIFDSSSGKATSSGLSFSNNSLTISSGSNITTNFGLLPIASSAYNLGTSSLQWLNTYTENLYATNIYATNLGSSESRLSSIYSNTINSTFIYKNGCPVITSEDIFSPSSISRTCNYYQGADSIFSASATWNSAAGYVSNKIFKITDDLYICHGIWKARDLANYYSLDNGVDDLWLRIMFPSNYKVCSVIANQQRESLNGILNDNITTYQNGTSAYIGIDQDSNKGTTGKQLESVSFIITLLWNDD